MARYQGGWFKSWRKAWESDLSKNIYLWGIWMALLHMATWKETKIIFEGKQKVLPPGSVVFGYRELGEKLEVSKTTIRRWVIYLRDTDRIRLATSPRGTIATICNWEEYQSFDDEDETLEDRKSTAGVPQGVHKVTLNEEYNNITIKELSNCSESPKADSLPAKSKPNTELNKKIWESYRAAYQRRWQTEPVRNAKVNRQISEIGKRLGKDAIEVVSFFVTLTDPFLVKNNHEIGLCVAKAESYRTQWALTKGGKINALQGRTIAGGFQRETSQSDEIQNAFDEVMNGN